MRAQLRGGLVALLLLPLLVGCSIDGEGERDPRVQVTRDLSTSEPKFRLRPGPVLAEPAANALDNKVVRTLRDAIAHVPRGGRIRVVGFSFSLRELARTLVAAHDRGVHVQVVMDGHSARYSATAVLRAGLGTDRRESSYLHLTKGSARGPGGHLHQKTWMFSETGQSRRVVAVGSTNPTYYGTELQYSDLYFFVNRLRIWRAFNDVFVEQRRDRVAPQLPRVEEFPGVTAYFNPGFSRDNDPIQDLLAALPGPGTQIRAASYGWHSPRGLALAARLADLRAAGADVRVLRGLYVSEPVTRVLRNGGVRVSSGVFGDENIHLKMLLVRDGATGRRYVVTGSDNWSDASFNKDDLDVRIDLTAGEYHAYARFLDAIAQRAAAR